MEVPHHGHSGRPGSVDRFDDAGEPRPVGTGQDRIIQVDHLRPRHGDPRPSEGRRHRGLVARGVGQSRVVARQPQRCGDPGDQRREELVGGEHAVDTESARLVDDAAQGLIGSCQVSEQVSGQPAPQVGRVGGEPRRRRDGVDLDAGGHRGGRDGVRLRPRRFEHQDPGHDR